MDEIILVPVPCDKVYALYKEVTVGKGPGKHVIPAGFRTDGASIPRFAWFTTGTPFAPQHIRAAVVHDYLYQTGRTTRHTADMYFRMLLRHDGVSAYQSWKMYWALRIGGWVAWRRYRLKERLLRKAVAAVGELSEHAKLDSSQSDEFVNYVVDETRSEGRKRQGGNDGNA